MPRKKINNNQIFSFDGLNIDSLVAKHIELLPTKGKGFINPKPILSENQYFDFISNKFNFTNFYNTEIKEWKKSENELISKINVPKKNKSILHDKYTFLIHQIIYFHVISHKGDQFITLSSEMLDFVLGDDYKIMLNTLSHLGISTKFYTYHEGQCSLYSILEPFDDKIIKHLNNNLKVQNYIDRATSFFLSKNNNQIKLNYKNFYSDNNDQFIKSYVKNLNRIKIYPSKFIDTYFNQYQFSSFHKKYHHQDVIHKLQSSNKIIYNIDHNGRIYHVLTSTKKLFKNLINIKFAIDTKNSQPLLLNNYLIQHYSIDFYFIQTLLSVEEESPYIYYFPQLLRNYNKGRKLRVPKNVAVYLYVTMKGMFWEEFAETFPDYPRDRIKIEMFKDLFFGKRHGHVWSDFTQKFKEKYPTIYSIINYKLKKDSYKDLSALLTRTESKIFHAILTKLFEMNIDAVNLHDSIVVLDTPNNKDVTEEKIIEVMKEVYYSYSIIPSFSTEYFSVSNFEEKVKQLIQ